MRHALTSSSLEIAEHKSNSGPTESSDVSKTQKCQMQWNPFFGMQNQSQIRVESLRSDKHTLRVLADEEAFEVPTPSAEFEGDHLSHIAQLEDPSFSTASLQIVQSLNDDQLKVEGDLSGDDGNRTQIDTSDQTVRRERLKAALILRKQNQQGAEEPPVSTLPLISEQPSLQLQLVCWMQAVQSLTSHQLMRPPRKQTVSNKEYLSPQLLAEVSTRCEEYTLGNEHTKQANYLPFIFTGSKRHVWTQRLTDLHLLRDPPHDSKHQTDTSFTSCMMFVVGFDREVFQLHELSNLFSVNGDVWYILYYREAKACFVVVKNAEQVNMCVKQLHKVTIRNQELQVRKHKHFEGLDPCYLYCQPEVFVPRSSYRRFKQDMPELTIGLSRVLLVHVTGCDEQRVEDDQLMKLLYSIKVRHHEVRRLIAAGRYNMWFVKYNRREKAAIAVMKLQGAKCHEGIVRISFTKSKVFMKKDYKEKYELETMFVPKPPKTAPGEQQLISPQYVAEEDSEESSNSENEN